MTTSPRHATGRTSILVATGSNGSAQLGIGHITDVSTFHRCVFLSSTGDLCGGPIAQGWTAVDLRSGSGHSLLLVAPTDEDRARGARNEVWATGSNEFGQVGAGKPRLSVGWRRLDVDGMVRRSRSSKDDKVHGRGRISDSEYEPKAIACSWTTSFVCFSRTGGRTRSLDTSPSDIVISFGSNDFHELGVGDVPPSIPSCTPHLVDIPAPANGQVHILQSLAAGQRHIVCVMDVLDTGTLVGSQDGAVQPKRQVVYGWGAARHGQLSIESFLERVDGKVSRASTSGDAAKTSAVAGPSSTKPRQPIRGKPPRLDRPKQPPKFPRTVFRPCRIDIDAVRWTTGVELVRADKHYITDVFLGAAHTVLQLATGRVIPLGSTAKSQTAGLTCDTAWSSIGCTWNGSYAVRPSSHGDEVVSMGSNTHGQLGRVNGSMAAMGEVAISTALSVGEVLVKRLACGSEHVVVLCSSTGGRNELVAWGWNEHGNLGVGDTVDRSTPVRVPLEDYGDAAVRWEVADCWAGCGTSWALLNQDTTPHLADRSE
jgi:protein ATS1